MFSGLLIKLYMALGVGALITYTAIETRGMVFSGTDQSPPVYSQARGSSGSRGGGGGGVFFWGSGYRGGK